MQREDALDALAEADLAHGEAGADAGAAVAADHHALVGLHARARALGDLVADPDRVAGGEVGDVLGQGLDLLGLELSDQVHRFRPSLPACGGGGVRVRELCVSCRVLARGLRHVGPPEVGTTFLRQPFRLGASPGGDASVVPREENLGYPQTFPFGRAGIVRKLQEAGREGFLLRRLGVSKDPAYKPDAGVDQGHCSDLAAGEDEIAEADLLDRRAAQHALVDSLEAAAEQRDAGAGGERPGAGLGEGRAAGGEVEDGPVGGGGVERGGGDVGAHHHAGAAAGRGVVDRAVAVGGHVADVAEVQPPEAVLQRPADEREAERAGEHLRVEGEDAGGPGGGHGAPGSSLASAAAHRLGAGRALRLRSGRPSRRAGSRRSRRRGWHRVPGTTSAEAL